MSHQIAILLACLDGGGVEGSRVELAKNKLILY